MTVPGSDAIAGLSDGQILDLGDALEAVRPGLPRFRILAKRIADEPDGVELGQLARACLRGIEGLFGPVLELYLECVPCGEPMDVNVDINHLLTTQPGTSTIDADGHRVQLRPLTIGDLRIAQTGAELGRRAVVSLDGQPPLSALSTEVLSAVSAGLASLDPLSDITLAGTCHACNAAFESPLEPADILDRRVQRHARALAHQVDRLARAYSWTEHEILALPPLRRARYLELADP